MLEYKYKTDNSQMCRECKNFKEISDDNFYKWNTKTWFRYICKQCHSERSAKIYLLSEEENIIRIKEAKKLRLDKTKENERLYKKSEQFRLWKLNYRHRRRQIIRTTSDWTVTQTALDELLASQSCKCPLCWIDISERSERHLDHVIPLSKWWLHTISNLQWLCPKCNMKKSNKLP